MILPSHIAIIMDGNGRWGLKKYNDRNKGHYYGLQNINKGYRDWETDRKSTRLNSSHRL